MNERIRKLVKQAELPLLDVDGKCKYGDTYFSTEKFAELIVRECMKLNRDILCEDDPDYLDKVYKEHFGVE
jgi:hypothetical protein